MKILILEDNIERIKVFKTHLFNEEKDFCTTAEQAIELLTAKKYDLVYLDHDLEGKPYEDSNYKNTGYQVAKVIPTTINKDTQIIIHSMNPIGAKAMRDVIGDNATYTPFGLLRWEAFK